mgnify:CR=1 FL=1
MEYGKMMNEYNFITSALKSSKENIEFWGSSFVADPYGVILRTASVDNPETMVVACDLSLVETARTHWPFFRDRRIDAYEDISKRWLN